MSCLSLGQFCPELTRDKQLLILGTLNLQYDLLRENNKQITTTTVATTTIKKEAIEKNFLKLLNTVSI